MILLSIISNVEIKSIIKKRNFLKLIVYSFSYISYIAYILWNGILKLFRNFIVSIVRISNHLHFLRISRFNSTEIQLLRLPGDVLTFVIIFLETSPLTVVIQIRIFCHLTFSTLSQTYFFFCYFLLKNFNNSKTSEIIIRKKYKKEYTIRNFIFEL